MSAFLGSTPTNNIQCPVIIKFSNSGKDVEVVSMNVEPEKCNNNTLERLPFNTKEIMDGTEYLTFVTFDQDQLFVSGVDFAIQSSAKCDHNLQNILNTSISTVVGSSGGAHSGSAPVIVGVSSVSATATAALGGGGGGLGGGGGSTVVSISSVPAALGGGITGGGVIVATTALTPATPTVSNPATTNFNPHIGDWIKFYQNYYKIQSFTKTDNKYAIKYEYNSYNNNKFKHSPAKTIELTCNPGTCSVITDKQQIQKLEGLTILTK